MKERYFIIFTDTGRMCLKSDWGFPSKKFIFKLLKTIQRATGKTERLTGICEVSSEDIDRFKSKDIDPREQETIREIEIENNL